MNTMLSEKEIVVLLFIISAVWKPCLLFPFPSSEEVCRRSNGLFPKEGSQCKSYFRCSNWYPVEEICPDGQHFIPAEEWCDWEYIYPCLEEPEAKECPRPNGKFVKKGTQCRSYYVCWNSKPYLKTCPEGQIFKQAFDGCEWIELYECIDDDEPIVSSTTIMQTTEPCESTSTAVSPITEITAQTTASREISTITTSDDETSEKEIQTTITHTTDQSVSTEETTKESTTTSDMFTNSEVSPEMTTDSSIYETSNTGFYTSPINERISDFVSEIVTDASTKSETNHQTSKLTGSELETTASVQDSSSEINPSSITKERTTTEYEYTSPVSSKSSESVRTSTSFHETTANEDAKTSSSVDVSSPEGLITSFTNNNTVTGLEMTSTISSDSSKNVEISTTLFKTTTWVPEETTSPITGSDSVSYSTSTVIRNQSIVLDEMSSKSSDDAKISTPLYETTILDTKEPLTLGSTTENPLSSDHETTVVETSTTLFKTTTWVPKGTTSPITGSDSVSYSTSTVIRNQSTVLDEMSSKSSDDAKISTPLYETTILDTKEPLTLGSTTENPLSSDHETTELGRKTESSKSSESTKTSTIPSSSMTSYPTDEITSKQTLFTQISSSSHVTSSDPSNTSTQIIITKSTQPKSVPISSSTTNQIFKTTQKDNDSDEDASSEEFDFFCPSPEGIFPHPTDKHKFVGCVDSIPTLLSCPEDLVYDHKIKACTYQF